MITVIASGFDNTINASAGHRASTSVLSRENPTIISSRAATQPSPRTEYIPRNQQQATEPAPVQRSAPGFRFGDESVNPPPAAPVQQPQPGAPAQQIPMQPQHGGPAPVQQIPMQPQPGAPAPAPAPVQQPQAPVQMGGRPQANVAPQPEAKPAQKSAKPRFMFGKDGQ